MWRLARVTGVSMLPTYRPQDTVLLRPVGPAGPSRGDVAVLRRGAMRLVKRVVGLGGDRVEMEAGRLFVNGVPVDGRTRVPGPATWVWDVPADRCFVVGDNAAASEDSRTWDEPFVPTQDVDAVVLARLPGLRRRTTRVTRRRRPAAARRAGRS
ncbi:signal peptidase I [Isoptericola sp. b441]|uniref:Signal peptidase I n=1 Tax=Actinotalea lenta TaxID=3064654 RepID=A0ABT9DDQ2_9CELL|nr:signal peptidase I [Isoptericola sp. b441]MDO8107127.1 signal peptidase I [Isoptericola sp. b441]